MSGLILFLVFALLAVPVWFFFWLLSLGSEVRKLRESLSRVEQQLRVAATGRSSDEVAARVTTPAPAVPAPTATPVTQVSTPPAPASIPPPPVQPPEPIRLSSVMTEKLQSKPPSPPVQKSPAAPSLTTKIAENWTGLLGILILVVGLAFFGVLTSLYLSAPAKVAILVAVGCAFFVLNLALRNNARWAELGAWLQVGGGAIILFACVGAGRVTGLKFISDPDIALIVLALGLSANVCLAFSARMQAIASLHVAFSLTALMVMPSMPLTLVLATVVTIAGIFLSYRQRWDLHLMISLLVYATFHLLWFQEIHTHYQLATLRMFGISSLICVGLAAAFVHYRKEYQTTLFEALPFAVHVLNWAILGLGLIRYSRGSKMAVIYLALAAVAAHLVAYVAKRKGIRWLYLTDTLVGQALAILALARLSRWGVTRFDEVLLVYLEILVFALVVSLQREKLLLRLAFAAQWIATLVLFAATLRQGAGLIDAHLDLSNLSLALKFLCLALLSSAATQIFCRGESLDNHDFVLSGTSSKQYSLLAAVASIMLVSVYALLVNESWAGWAFVLLLAILTCCGPAADTQLFKKISVGAWFLGHIAACLTLRERSNATGVEFLTVFLPWLVCDLIVWRIGLMRCVASYAAQLTRLVIYLLAANVAFCAYRFLTPYSNFAPGLAYIVCSLIFLELALWSYGKKKDDLADHDYLLHGGVFFLLLFLLRHLSVHLHLESSFGFVSYRLLVAIVGACTLVYWAYAFRQISDKWGRLTNTTASLLADCALAFVLFIFAYECEARWHPVIWSALASALLIAGPRLAFPLRFLSYSWLLLIVSAIQLAFVTSNSVFPSAQWWNGAVFTGLLTIVLQLCYVIAAHRTPALGTECNFPPALFLFKALHRAILIPRSNRQNRKHATATAKG